VPTSLLWRGGARGELAFWEKFFAAGGGDWRADYVQRIDPAAPLGEPLIETRLERLRADPVTILDVGAGPTSSLGKVVPGRELRIVGVDPLADAYRSMLVRLGIEVPAPSRCGRAEELERIFAPASFDVVYARNSLDHTADPIAALRGMLRLVKPAGFVALRHFRREGERAGYEEFHQWNFDVRDAGPEIWNRSRRYLLKDCLPARVEQVGWDEPWITTVLVPTVSA
jgi:SAM-dependent methyltransferase